MTMKYSDFERGLKLALNSKTTYAFGGFGFPLNQANKTRLLNNPNNTQFKTAINAGNENTFAFDCVCLIKAILWGWNGNSKLNYGGAVYKSNGVPDINADQMRTSTHMTEISTDFSKIKIGAFVGMKGHIGVYIGNGEVIECTPIWGAKVMITRLVDRKWVNWGMSKYIDYAGVTPIPTPKPEPAPSPTTKESWIRENGVFKMSMNVYERNNPTTSDASGRKLISKSEQRYVAYCKVNGYVWLLLPSGKVVPWRVIDGEKYGVCV